MKIILFGGSFDPIHQQHLNIAKKALDYVKAKKVVFVLNNKSKDKTCDAQVLHRWKMLKLAIKKYPFFSASKIELVNKKKISYTIDTINYFLKKYKVIYLLIGSDQYLKFNEWKNHDKILQKVKLIVFLRKGYDIKTTDKNIIFINEEVNDYSSSNIKNNNQWNLVPSEVNDYINDCGLYFNYRIKLFEITEKRLLHSYRVAKMCKNIMHIYNPKETDFAWSAGLYHDVYKCAAKEWLEKEAYEHLKLRPMPWTILHGPVAAAKLPNLFNFKNQIILNAIHRHTNPLSDANINDLTMLDKVLFCCDKLEPYRNEEDVSNIAYFRTLLKKDLHRCFIELLTQLQAKYQ